MLTIVEPFDLILEREHSVGDSDGFFQVRRLYLRNRWPDGTTSAPYRCEFIDRPKGTDAVVVVLWRPTTTGPRVLLRKGLRPALRFGRTDVSAVPVPDPTPRLWMIEVVAGILERGDLGKPGILRRAAQEAWEEAGIPIAPDDFGFLGAGTYPTPGSMAEQYWIVCARVPDDTEHHPPPGDGSPMEDGATIEWRDLDAAIDDCMHGLIADAKTELALRRLRDRLNEAARDDR